MLQKSALTNDADRRSSSEPASTTYLCRFRQRNRLIAVPIASEAYHQCNGITHDYLRQLIMQEFELESSLKAMLIIQLWNEQHQEYIDIESFKRIPLEGRLQVLVDKEANSPDDSSSTISKSPSTSVSSQTITPVHNSPTLVKINLEHSSDEPASSVSSLYRMDRLAHSPSTVVYDLLPKPSEGIPIPRFPPHIAAFLNGNGDANQLNALVQALYQEIVKYELYPNADELRSIVGRLVDRHPPCVTVIGSVELLVRKLYYKFCNERKKYPIELKRRQPNKKKRPLRDEENNRDVVHQRMFFGPHDSVAHEFHPASLDRLMHLWTNAEYKEPRSGSSSSSSSPQHSQEHSGEPVKYHPLNLSTSISDGSLMCTE